MKIPKNDPTVRPNMPLSPDIVKLMKVAAEIGVILSDNGYSNFVVHTIGKERIDLFYKPEDKSQIKDVKKLLKQEGAAKVDKEFLKYDGILIRFQQVYPKPGVMK